MLQRIEFRSPYLRLFLRTEFHYPGVDVTKIPILDALNSPSSVP